MDKGRELLLALARVLDFGDEFSIRGRTATCSSSPKGEGTAVEEVDTGPLESCRSRRGGGEGTVTESGLESGFDRDGGKLSLFGDSTGVGVLESLPDAESCAINESTIL